MNKITLLVFSICILFSKSLLSQDFCKQWKLLQDVVATNHYSPKSIDDEMSEAVFDLMINAINDTGFHFLKSDFDAFEKDKTQLDDYLSNKDCSFLTTYVTTFEKRIQESKNIISELSSATLSYDGKDTLHFTRNNGDLFYKNIENKKRYWRKSIKYRTITKYINEAPEEKHIENDFLAVEKTYRTHVIENALCQLDEILSVKNGIQRQFENIVLDAFVKYQDPHSSFLDTQDKTAYEAQLATSQVATGVQTYKNNEGAIEVSYITPGSNAFKNRNITEGDIIVSVTIKDTTIDLSCFSNDELQRQIQDTFVEEVTFNIRKNDGVLKQITLVKSKIEVEENNLTGFVITGEKRIGFISIPSFYTDYESPNGLGMANDVARELYKLQKMNIDALIIDVRDNGGGSMKEAIDLSGLFIDRGPVAILKDQAGETATLRDSNRGVAFTKPLAILVNEYSASASEFFSAAMQDYNRALIIGATTYGKSSAQVMIPLQEDDENSDFTKLTSEVFYRATGKSHQAQGVIPDITLPSIYTDIASSEASEKYPLPNDDVIVKLKARPLPVIAKEVLSKNSKARIQGNSTFSSITDSNKKLVAMLQENDHIPVSFSKVKEYLSFRDELWDSFRDASSQEDAILTIENTITTTEINGYDATAKKANEQLLSNMSTDPYIIEASNILKDYLKN
ncbi:carboxy terminal-processing peptidase [uncultured Dokdonia sp.]|uniref:carboxy terminal-processing peptidase n=1 Tax=uncultured Dokdonia sp. TaxID=575653 RepID=UPI002638D5D3|nr:carboxy terminal-processing peptidase [uncultured Dokdonia sp.]